LAIARLARYRAMTAWIVAHLSRSRLSAAARASRAQASLGFAWSWATNARRRKFAIMTFRRRVTGIATAAEKI